MVEKKNRQLSPEEALKRALNTLPPKKKGKPKTKRKKE